MFTPHISLVLTVLMHRGMARLSWPGCLVIYRDGLPAYPSTNRARRRLTSVIETNVFTTRPCQHHPLILTQKTTINLRWWLSFVGRICRLQTFDDDWRLSGDHAQKVLKCGVGIISNLLWWWWWWWLHSLWRRQKRSNVWLRPTSTNIHAIVQSLTHSLTHSISQ